MAIPHNIKDWWRGQGTKAQRLGDWMNRVARFLNLIEGTTPIRVSFTGSSVKISLDEGYVAVPEPPASGFHVLTASDGTLSWQRVVDCEGEETE